MPREADPRLESRILNAARKLWNRGGAKALTMRAVAKAAATTTPTVYERFKDKQDILAALRHQAEISLFTKLEPCRTPMESCQQYLDFALTRPSEYELLFTALGSRAWHSEPRPSLELMKRSLAERLSGSPEDHMSRALALWALLHGTATLLVASRADQALCQQLRQSCLTVFETLVSNGKRNPDKPSSTRKS